MNIAQELSIVRDNIAEYGMTNITQLEYDAIYQQGRADERKKIMEILDSADDEESAAYVLAQYLIAETVKEQWNES